MKSSKRELTIGMGLLVSFLVVLGLLFTPVMEGQRPIDYLDNLYNSISKGSVYYIPRLMNETKKYEEKQITFPVGFLNEQQAEEMSYLFSSAGSQVEKGDKVLQVTGNLGELLAVSLDDADLLFHNQGDKLLVKYNHEARTTLYYWWLGLKAVDKQLTREKRFEEALFVNSVITRAVECSFNYYGVEPRNISTEVLFVVISLLFYVLYTLWFGFAVMNIFVGLGLKLEH